MYILVHLEVSVGSEVVDVGEPVEPGVHVRVAGGGARDAEGAGAAGSYDGSSWTSGAPAAWSGTWSGSG